MAKTKLVEMRRQSSRDEDGQDGTSEVAEVRQAKTALRILVESRTEPLLCLKCDLSSR